MRLIFTAFAPLVVTLLLASPALADRGGNGNGNNGNGNGNGGSSSDGSNGNPDGNANGHDKDGNAVVEAPATDAIVAVPNDQQVARDAVRSKAALSLEAITAIVKSNTAGRILDVQLVTFKGTYLYDVTVLEANGVLHKLYYYARSGAPVRTN